MQFTTRTLLQITAGVSVVAAVYPLAWLRVIEAHGSLPPSSLFVTAGEMSPFWVPVVVAAYAAGRRLINWTMIVLLAFAEVLAFGAQHWAMEHLFTFTP